MQGNIWDIPAHYKNCQKKLYTAHVCMPDYQTYVANKYGPEATDINLRPVIGSKYSVLASKVKGNEALKNLVTNAAMGGYGGLTSKNTPFVVAGSRGELTVMSPLELQQNFDFASGAGATPINMETLKKRTSADNQLEWTAIKSKQASLAGRFMACFVPKNQQGQINTVRGIQKINQPGIPHGKGDFVVCTMLPNGTPNLGERWVVNGEIFCTTFNNQGWTQFLDANVINSNPVQIVNLPKLTEAVEKVPSKYKDVLPLFNPTIHSAFVNTVELLSDSARYNTPQQARDLMKSIMSGEAWGYLSKVADYYREKASDPSFTFAKDNNTSELFAFVVYGAIYETIAKDESLFKEWWRVTSGFKNLSNHLIDESHAEIYCDGHYFCLCSIQDNLYRPTDGCEHLKMKVSAKEDTASLEVYEEVLHMPGKDVIAFCTGSDYGQQGTTYLKLKMSTFKPSSPDVKKLVTKKLKDASDVYTSHLLKVVCNSLTNMLNWAGFKATAGARKNTIKLESIAELTGANNKLNTTLYFGVSPDKQSIGVRAREGGLSCDIRVKVANVVDYVNYERIYLTLLFKLCAELHISPFQYLISRACVQATHNFIKNLGMTVTVKDNKINTTKGEGGHNQALTYSMCVRAVDGSVKAFPIKFWLNEGDRLKALDSLYSGDIEELLDCPENICEFGVSIGDAKKIVNEFDGRLAAYFCAEFFVKAIVIAIGDMRIKDDFKKEVLSNTSLSDTQRKAYRWLAENFLYSPRWGLGQLSFDGTKIKAFGRQGGLGFSYNDSSSVGQFEFYSCPEGSSNFTLVESHTAAMGTKQEILHTKIVVDRKLARVFHDTPTALQNKRGIRSQFS